MRAREAGKLLKHPNVLVERLTHGSWFSMNECCYKIVRATYPAVIRANKACRRVHNSGVLLMALVSVAFRALFIYSWFRTFPIRHFTKE